MERRLPVYFLIDCSHSMRGQPIALVRQGLDQMTQDLRKDPFALETVYLSILTFSTGARQDVPLTPVYAFRMPELAAKGRTDLGAGLKLLVECLDSEVQKTSEGQKGDWRPIAFLLSDGGPGDNWIKPAKAIMARHEARALTMIAVAFGDRAHVDKLRQVTPQVILSESTEPESFAKFLAWTSVSISRSCSTGPERADVYSQIPLPSGFVRVGN
ncbi:MAG TPA: VWA domain-containing protein [Acidobacteriota bacterium]|nr:VWA domain-containing protein [Acidobacteriota bacterium]